MTQLRQAIAIYLPDESVFRVGSAWAPGGVMPSKTSPEITAITITDDLPGLYCNLERARLWVGDHCVYEAPVHMLEGIEYDIGPN